MAKSSSWYTGGGYASSAVDVYVSGGSTEMFGSVSSGGGSSSPAPPVTKTCANRNAACEWVPSWDTDGLYCSLGSGNYCVDLCDSSLDASACDAADGCVHDGSSCRRRHVRERCPNRAGTDIDVSQVFAEFPDNFFDGSYIRTGYSLNGEPVIASTESSPALLLYYGTCSQLSDDDGAWLLHLTFADPTNSAAVAEDTVNCPHLVQLRSGRRLPGKARADNAKATTVSSGLLSTVDGVRVGERASALRRRRGDSGNARVESTTDGTSYGLFDGAYTLGNAATVNWQPLLKKQTELMTWYMYYCARLGHVGGWLGERCRGRASRRLPRQRRTDTADAVQCRRRAASSPRRPRYPAPRLRAAPAPARPCARRHVAVLAGCGGRPSARRFKARTSGTASPRLMDFRCTRAVSSMA